MTVYYNEIEPYAAEWLRNLIKEGLIAHGEVDTRSIVDVQPGDLAGYTQCHFFAGLGGWSGALRLAGIPDTEPLWTGSCPCQPFSLAGKQKGFDDERHLWPVWSELIRVRRPAKVLGEQVASASAWLGVVRGDLEAMGYAVGAIPCEAASAGADHLRDRYWFVAHANDAGSQGRGLLPECADQRAVGVRGLADADGAAIRYEPGRGSGADGTGAREHSDDRETGLDVAYAGGDGAGRGSASGAGSQGASECQHGDSPRSGVAARLDGETEWVIGADGKARRVGPDLRRLVDGLSAFLAGLRARCYQEVVEKMREYAEATQGGPVEILQAMWCGVSTEDDRLPLGGQDRIYSERILFACLCECARRYEPTRPFGESQEATREILRSLQLDGKSARAPRQWRHHDQYAGQYPDALRALSYSFSQHVVAAWSAHFRKNAQALRLLEHGVPARVAKLRAFGNAIDLRPAAAFIQAAIGATR